MLAFSLFQTFISCWGTVSHNEIGIHSFRILSSDKITASSFYQGQNAQFHHIISKGFVDPDWEEKKMGTHYYIWPGPVENHGQYFKNAFFSFSRESARTRLENHYSQAISDYCAGLKEGAFLHLGRACHYLQDIACPPHAGGIQYTIIGPNDHAMYESFIDSIVSQEEFHSQTAVEHYGELDDDHLGYTLNEISKRSAQYVNFVKSRNETKYLMTIDMIGMSDEYTAVLLEKFARDVQECEKMDNQTVPITRHIRNIPVATKSSL